MEKKTPPWVDRWIRWVDDSVVLEDLLENDSGLDLVGRDDDIVVVYVVFGRIFFFAPFFVCVKNGLLKGGGFALKDQSLRERLFFLPLH